MGLDQLTCIRMVKNDVNWDKIKCYQKEDIWQLNFRMTRTTKKYVSPVVKSRMYEILVGSVAKAQKKGDVVNFLTDLLSPPEREMLAKRLAIAYLLVREKYTHREISNILKVGLGTIQRVSRVLEDEGSGYSKIIPTLKKDVSVEEFIDGLVELIGNLDLRPGPNYGTIPRYKPPNKY